MRGPETEDDETRLVAEAAAGGPSKRDYVRAVFEKIAPSYDLLNRLLSFGIDRAWRRRAIAALAWERDPTGSYLDLCAGTMDVAATLVRSDGFSGRVVALDFAESMLRAGRGKMPEGTTQAVVADALWLPLRDSSISGAVVAFGARNVADLDAAFREVHRVLKPGARFVLLEFTTPRSAIVRTLYHAYFRRVLPAIGGAISGHRTAYRYLPESVARFPAAEELAARMRAVGFASVSWSSLTFGIAAIHAGQRR
ncbi:MAG: ubiquinone/menaquinone biosynthesis methyltransferase [Gemmatimonadaceae bacterium]|nr:ubiquinone/menaquinone biosynthesis methyltransferase [Gemmatimonadaceae bacterium]